MKKILLFWIYVFGILSCQKNEDYIYENPMSLGDIKFITLKADHKMLLPNGKAQMQFYITAYGIKELPDYSATYNEDTISYIPKVSCDTFVIPADIIPSNILELYDEDGNYYPDLKFSTKDTKERDITFCAKVGELESEKLTIRIRPLPQEEYEEIVFPVVFHVLTPALKAGEPVYDITAETIEKNIERLNNVFNGAITTDPNGGNAKISFRAALYDPSGVKLSEPGIHRWDVSANEDFEEIEDFEAYILKNSMYLIYDYSNYLNIWLINYPSGSSFSVKVPNVILPGETISGLDAMEWPLEVFPSSPRDIGFFINMEAFLNPLSSSDFFEISNPMAQFFGLLTTQASENYGISNIVDGDTDFCPDTYYYWNDNSSIFKNTSKDGLIGEDTEYFTSYNVMDRYSKKTSVSVDQVTRIREHIKKCPSRWMYQSRFPFTGRQEDWIE